MSNSRCITKLEVKIATGETFITYNDATTRYIRHAETGFLFDCKRATDTIQAANLLQPNSRSARLKAKRQQQQATTQSPYKLATASSLPSVVANLTMTTSVIRATQSMADITPQACSTTCCNEATAAAEASEIETTKFCTVDFSKSLQMLPSNKLYNLKVIKSILPELLTTNVQLPVDVFMPEQDLHKPQAVRLVTWHLSFCTMKYEKGLPLCNCLEIKKKLTLLRENLNQFLNTTHKEDYVNFKHFVTNFLQLFITLQIHLTQLYELINKNIEKSNEQLKNVKPNLAKNSVETDLTEDEESIASLEDDDLFETDLSATISTDEEELTEKQIV